MTTRSTLTTLLIAAMVGLSLLMLADIGRMLHVISGYEQEASTDHQLIEAYELRHGQVDFEDRAMILDHAHLVCVGLANEADIPRIFNDLIDRGMSSDMAATTIDLGVQYLCPELEPLKA